jgi:hypothetical protein
LASSEQAIGRSTTEPTVQQAAAHDFTQDCRCHGVRQTRELSGAARTSVEGSGPAACLRAGRRSGSRVEALAPAGHEARSACSSTLPPALGTRISAGREGERAADCDFLATGRGLEGRPPRNRGSFQRLVASWEERERTVGA